MDLMGALSICLENLTETPRRFLLVGDHDWWSRCRKILKEPESVIEDPFWLAIEGHRIGARLLFRGSIAGSATLTCGRCLEPYVQAFDEPLQLLLEPAPAGERLPEGGLELDPEDAALGRYQGDEIDLDAAVLELLALAWPMQPLCSETCQGLCPGCGTNLNQRSCECEAGTARRPFSGLRELIERSRSGRDEAGERRRRR